MSEFEDKLNAILSDPNAMAQVANLAQSLNLGGLFGDNGPPQNSASPQPPSTASLQDLSNGNPLSSLGDLAGLGELLGQVDPTMIARLLPLVRELTSQDASDDRMALLMALRPFLKPERREKVERAAKAARLLHVGKQFLTAMGDNNV